jgi:hypothetical protein
MITDSQFLEQDAQMLDIFKEEARVESSTSSQVNQVSLIELEQENLRRIERIVERAKFTLVVEHSVSFLFKTLGSGISELATASVGVVKSVSPKNAAKKITDDKE